ncbi:MAG TPA: YceI family protein [Longimicrobiaceae bacterium]|nr:YceI family protein [Longimicrobiaceae bacterium]
MQGTSSVRSYTCRAARVDGTVATQPGATSVDITQLEKAVRSAEVSVAVAGLECGNATMNTHTRKALKGDANPRITYRITSYDVTPAGEAEGTVKLNGTLAIAGTEKAVSIDATATTELGRLRVRGSRQIRMTEFGVQPPSLMMGTMKVHDPVTVRFDVLLKP